MDDATQPGQGAVPHPDMKTLDRLVGTWSVEGSSV